MDCIIVTGLSGAGKSKAMDALEDIGFFCMDNIPPMLVSKVADLCTQTADKISRVAMAMDTRGGRLFDDFFVGLSELNQSDVDYKILYLEADEKTLARRYKETRRRHPLLQENDSSVENAIKTEIELLAPIRSRADYIIDTSFLSPAQLRERIVELFAGDVSQGMQVHIMSFGFKYASPSEADLVFDVRCLPNPYYIDELRSQTGLNPPVSNYVMQCSETVGFIKHLFGMIDYMLPLYINEGKSQLVIAIGCTGGKHRSVTIAEQLYSHLKDAGMRVTINHRDIKKI